MLVLAALSPRALYYVAKSYAEQSSAGEDYTRLRRTISICFVNGVVFRDWPEHHTCFRLLDRSGELCLTEDLEIHLIELPKFRKALAELETDLDFWLSFLKNGQELDADALPEELDRWEIRKAMGVLKIGTKRFGAGVVRGPAEGQTRHADAGNRTANGEWRKSSVRTGSSVTTRPTVNARRPRGCRCGRSSSASACWDGVGRMLRN